MTPSSMGMVGLSPGRPFERSGVQTESSKEASKGNRPGTGDETLGKVMESDSLDEISDGKSMI